MVRDQSLCQPGRRPNDRLVFALSASRSNDGTNTDGGQNVRSNAGVAATGGVGWAMQMLSRGGLGDGEFNCDRGHQERNAGVATTGGVGLAMQMLSRSGLGDGEFICDRGHQERNAGVAATVSGLEDRTLSRSLCQHACWWEYQ